MILLVGATGRLGTALAKRLLDDGVPFRAACRDVAQARSLIDRGVEVVALDVETGHGVSEAIAGSTKVVTCIHGLMGRSRASIERIDVRGHAALIDAARAAGVGRFVYVSALGASPDHPSEFWRAKFGTEQYLKDSGLEYVVLRPSAFMDLYAHDLIGAAVLRGKPVVILGSGTMARNMIAVDDVAAVAVAALSRPDLAHETIEIGGWESLTERDVADVYARLSGRRAKIYTVPAAALPALATVIAPLHAGVGRLLRLPLQIAGREELHLDSTAWTTRLGIDPVRLRDYAARRLTAADRAG